MTSKNPDVSAAVKDLIAGLQRYPLWWALSLNEIRQRYRRSVIGPFWLSLSMLIMVLALGLVYGQLFSMDIKTYIPFLAIGLIFWNFLASIVSDGCQTFIASSSYMKQLALPKSLFALQTISRNFLIFAHNAIVILLILMFFGVTPDLSALYAVPLGLFLIIITGLSLAIVLGGLSARYRDIPQIIGSIMQVLFFVTPVMFRGDMLKNHDWLLTYNPLYYYIEFIRRPLLGGQPPAGSLMVVLLITTVSVVVAIFFLARFRQRITYWV